MKVEMIDGLAAVFTRVHDDAIALGESLGAGNLSGCPMQMAENRALAFIGILHGDNVLARHNQHMHGRLRMKVGKGIHQIILEDGRRWNLAFNDLAKYAVHGDPSVSCAGASGKIKRGRFRLGVGGRVLFKTIQIKETNFLLDIMY